MGGVGGWQVDPAAGWRDVPGLKGVMYNRANKKVGTKTSPLVYTLDINKPDDHLVPLNTNISGTNYTLQDVYDTLGSFQYGQTYITPPGGSKQQLLTPWLFK